jgi:hypothetical protein
MEGEMTIITDPIEYPFVFALDDRKISPVIEGVSSVILAMSTGNPLFSVACRYSDTYSLDHDPFAYDVSRATSGRKVVYEFVPSTQDPETATMVMKSWLSSTDVGAGRQLDPLVTYGAPSTTLLQTTNREGFAVAPVDECVDGKRRAWMTTDGGNAYSLLLFVDFPC